MAKQTSKPQAQAPAAKKVAPAPVRRTETRENIFSAGKHDFIFGRQNFIYMGIGLGLVALGLILMSGGAMPDPNKWEPERIYSFRRITLAPMMMLAGFVAVIVGIFKKNTAAQAAETPVAE
jgi:type IV secretory pathway TrbD component